ncbi:MAG: HEAT repeat domain-containing protein [Planctomycetota bacterium]|jgi:HEAT repeat protein
MMLGLILLLPMALTPHGGQYLPPALEPAKPTLSSAPDPMKDVVSQPGLGPELAFSANRWEWWLDFNGEELLQLRDRLPRRAAAAAAPAWEPVSDETRARVVLPVLVEALRPERSTAPGVRRATNTRDVRAAAVLALGHLARSDAVPYIELVAETDPDLFVRTQAILALGFSGSSQAVETLERLYGDEDLGDELRTYAVAALALIGNAQAVDTIKAALTEKALSGQSNQLRAATVYASGLCGDPLLGAALRELAGTWLFEKEPQVRALVAVAQGRIGDPASVPFLLELLKDPDNQVRRSAAAALGGTPARLDVASVEALIAQYQRDADAPTRVNLLRALGHARMDAARAFLRATLPGATFEFRPHVGMALALDGHPGNVQPLLAALAEENEQSVRSAMIVALGLLEADVAADTLIDVLEEERAPFTRGYVCLALGLINPGQSDLPERFDRIVRDENDVELVRWAMIALGLVGAGERLDALAGDVGSIRSIVSRATIVHGLGLVGDRGTVEPLIRVFRDPTQPSYVRTYALQALGELVDPRPLSPAARLSSHVELNHDVGFLFELYRVL